MTTFAEAVKEKQQSLNPALWSGDKLKADVRSHILTIAASFLDGLKTYKIDPLDIVITGSNANYNWSPSSDLDLHIMADLGKVDCDSQLVLDFFHAHSFTWNEHHDIKLNGVPVEIYVQDIKEPHYASGVFSVQKNKWVKRPKLIEYPPAAQVEQKAKPLVKRIEKLLKSANGMPPMQAHLAISAIRERIRMMRKAALAKHGETAIENLVFKHLRNHGQLDRLLKMSRDTYDRAMSLGEHALASEISMSIQEMGTWE